jgi:hypothetical protein
LSGYTRLLTRCSARWVSLGFFPRRPDDRNELSNQVSLS